MVEGDEAGEIGLSCAEKHIPVREIRTSDSELCGLGRAPDPGTQQSWEHV